MNAIKGTDIEWVVVNDGNQEIPFFIENYIRTKGREGVAVAKNKGIRFLLDRGCEHIFLHEDDIEIIHPDVFDAYINASKSTGIKHFNFGLHGNTNLNFDSSPNIRKTVRYPDGTDIDFYPNLLGAFSYYHKDVFDAVGLMDERFFNSMDHIDHSYRAELKGFASPFRFFADIHDSGKYLKDIVPEHQQSVIRDANFRETFKKGLDQFIKLNGFSVVQGYGPQEIFYSEAECLNFLRLIYTNKKS